MWIVWNCGTSAKEIHLLKLHNSFMDLVKINLRIAIYVLELNNVEKNFPLVNKELVVFLK